MPTPSSIPYTERVNFDTGDDRRARRAVHRLVLAIEAVQRLGTPYDSAIDPLLGALTITARTADSLRGAAAP